MGNSAYDYDVFMNKNIDFTLSALVCTILHIDKKCFVSSCLAGIDTQFVIGLLYSFERVLRGFFLPLIFPQLLIWVIEQAERVVCFLHVLVTGLIFLFES